MADRAIICVDDEKIILDSLKAQLKKQFGSQYQYEIAENADDAMELIEELCGDSIDVIVIVSDWLMPGIKGDEFLIRMHEKFPKIVKIMLTGQASQEAIENAVNNANLHRYISKPWSENELIEAIRTGIEKL